MELPKYLFQMYFNKDAHCKHFYIEPFKVQTKIFLIFHFKNSWNFKTESTKNDDLFIL